MEKRPEPSPKTTNRDLDERYRKLRQLRKKVEQAEKCPGCNEPANPIEDVVGSAIQKAMELGATVEVATEDGKLDEIFGIGAVLFY